MKNSLIHRRAWVVRRTGLAAAASVAFTLATPEAASAAVVRASPAAPHDTPLPHRNAGARAVFAPSEAPAR